VKGHVRQVYETNQLTAALPIYVFPWWLPYLLLAILILVALIILWKKKIITVRLPRIATTPKISKPKLTVRRRKVKPFKPKLPKPSRKTLAIVLSLLSFITLYVSYSWRTWPFTAIIAAIGIATIIYKRKGKIFSLTERLRHVC